MFTELSEIHRDHPTLASGFLDFIVLNRASALAHYLWPVATLEVRCVPFWVFFGQFRLELIHRREQCILVLKRLCPYCDTINYQIKMLSGM